MHQWLAPSLLLHPRYKQQRYVQSGYCAHHQYVHAWPLAVESVSASNATYNNRHDLPTHTWWWGRHAGEPNVQQQQHDPTNMVWGRPSSCRFACTRWPLVGLRLQCCRSVHVHTHAVVDDAYAWQHVCARDLSVLYMSIYGLISAVRCCCEPSMLLCSRQQATAGQLHAWLRVVLIDDMMFGTNSTNLVMYQLLQQGNNTLLYCCMIDRLVSTVHAWSKLLNNTL